MYRKNDAAKLFNTDLMIIDKFSGLNLKHIAIHIGIENKPAEV